MPFSETFETANAVTNGALNGQNGWQFSGTGAANVQTGVVNTGSQALEIQSGTVTHTASNNAASVWVSFYTRCSGIPASTPSIAGINTSVAFYVNTNLNLVVYNGTNQVVLNSRIQTNIWTRFDLFCDYGNPSNATWSLGINGTNAAAGLAFYSTNRLIEQVLIANDSAVSAFVDEINITADEPATGLIDTDKDGIPDWWELKYFGSITNVSPDAILQGGLNRLQQYIAGLDPSDTNDLFKTDRAGGKKFSWNRKINRQYDVYWTSNLVSGFTCIQTNVTGSDFEDINTNRTETASSFYQLRVRK